jgi:hypothetical protein
MAKILVVNLEEGMPTANQACLRLDYELQRAAREHAAAVKLIHGYGSSGVGGALRHAIQAALRRKLHDGKIRTFVAGEQWRISDETAWSILKKCPELKADRDLGRDNKGISIVLL